MFHRIWNLVHKEFIQLFRDRLLAPLVIIGPMAELLMIAWSTSQGIDHLPTAVLDLDKTASSRELIEAMEISETFDPYMVSSIEDVSDDVESGRAMAAWARKSLLDRRLLPWLRQMSSRSLGCLTTAPD